jgi:vitamin B12 transporter
LHQEFNSVSSRTNTILINGHFRPTKAHDLIAGYEHDDLKTTLSVDGEELKITNDAAFAEYRWMGYPDLQTSIAVRMDHDSVNGSRFSPRLTASYQANGYLRIHGSAGTGYRRPEPEEVRFIEIKRERAEGLDFGADIVPSKRISVSAVFFHTLYSDTIVNLGFFGPRNLPAYTTTGVELDAGALIAEGLKIRGTYTLTHGQSQSLPPEHAGSVQLNYEHRALQCSFNWYLAGSGLITEAHTRADAVVSVDLWKELQVYGRVTNLFDSKYVEFTSFQAEGRAAYFGLRWN